MIKLDNLSIGYISGRHCKVVAEHLCANTDDGTLVCLVGVNGVGKSTLLRTVGGFQKPIAGRVMAGAAEHILPVDAMTQRERSRLIGVVLTERSDLSRLSVFDIVSFGRMPFTGLLGTLTDSDIIAVREAIDLVGINHLAERDIDTLSDGERQKVMIAKALAQQTPVIILDEPSAFLDYPSKEELMRLLLRLARDGKKTILVSSHDLDIVRRFADSFWIMENIAGTATIRTEKTLLL